MSGEFVRQSEGELEPFRPKSAKRRALHPSSCALEEEGELESELPRTKQEEEQTLRSARAPQRIRMSLRMRRVAAGSSGDPAAPLRAEDQVGLRHSGRVFQLAPGSEAIAGRSAGCTIVLGDRLCSRQHAAFDRAEDGSVRVRDLGSTNGTYVNGVRIAAPQPLAPSDWITLGNETLELCVSPALTGAQRPTTPAARQPKARAARERAERSEAKTDPGSALLSLASFAATSAARPSSTPLRANIVRKPLDTLLRRLERGESIDEADARMGALVALHLAKGSDDSAWLDYAFRLYAVLGTPMPEDLIERLRETLAGSTSAASTWFGRYIEILAHPRLEFDDRQQQLVTQLTELHARLKPGAR